MPLPIPSPEDDDRVSADVVQLLLVSTFNGLCHALAALARRGHFTEDEIGDMAEAMTSPLDDIECRDNDVICAARATVESILAKALASTRIAQDEGRR